MILRWLPRAIRDRDAQIDFIAERAPMAAVGQGDRIDWQVDQLLEQPKLGPPGRLGRVAGTRELVISGTPFIVVYRYTIRAKRIDVIRVLHGARQCPPLSE